MWLAAWQAAQPAIAAGEGIDIEWVRPSFSAGAIAGLDNPRRGRPGTLRLGAAVSLVDDPLVLYSNGAEAASIVHRRATLWIGTQLDVDRRLSLRASLPAAWQWAGEARDRINAGPGVGDLGVGVRVQLRETAGAASGLRIDARLPTATRDSWLGDREPRLITGVSTTWTRQQWTTLVDAGLTLRTGIETGDDLYVGPEANLAAALQRALGHDLRAFASIVTRTGLYRLWTGDGEHGAEVSIGAGLNTARGGDFTVAAGRGLGTGYGTGDWRVTLTTVFDHRPPAKHNAMRLPEPVEPTLLDVRTPGDDDADSEPVSPLSATPPLATLGADRIEVRDPVRFYKGTARLLPESEASLAAVATVLLDPAISLLIIEGHASEEGTFEYNYRLSTDRARAVYESLIEAGVAPDRLAYRGLGEVIPAEAVPASRRVEFRVIRLPTPTPAGRPHYRPWDGAPMEAPEEKRP